MYGVKYTPNEETRQRMAFNEMQYKTFDGEIVSRPRGPVEPYTADTKKRFTTKEDAQLWIDSRSTNPAVREQYSIFPVEE